MSQLSSSYLQAPDWNAIDSFVVHSVKVQDQALLLKGNQATLSLAFVRCEAHLALRLRSAESKESESTQAAYKLLENEPQNVSFALEKVAGGVRLSCEAVKVSITFDPFTLAIQCNGKQHALGSTSDGHFVRKHRIPPLAKTADGWIVGFNLKSNEAVYGLGEKWGKLDKRGQIVRSFNHDALGVNAELSYKNTPFCWSHEGWGLFVHTPSPVVHAVGFPSWSQRSYVALVEDQTLDLFLFLSQPSDAQHNAGANVIGAYTSITGRAPMPPLWSTGVILSKAYYTNEQEILDVARAVRAHKMPCDVITFDGRAWQDTNTRFAFEWDAKRYPDPAVTIAKLKELNFKVCVWEYPLISVSHPWFAEFADKGWLLRDARTGEAFEYDWDAQAFGDVLTPLPRSGLVDFTHPDAYAFWRDAHKPLFEIGVDMIKADFGEQLEDPNLLAYNGETGLALHNVYAHLYNRCVFEAAQRYSKSGAFLFSRASWTGCQRFNSQWGGDPQADWEGMMGNIRGGISWGHSGAPFYATDVGGFYKDQRNDALYVRWAQAAIFSAHFRLHGIGAREPWSYSNEARDAVMHALKLRYQLQAYLYKTIKASTETGMPVQRSMALAFANQKVAWSFENQFMFGEDLLVVPCFDPEGHVEFYLPDGHWYPFDPGVDHSHDMLVGGKLYHKKLKLNQMAVFARSGTKIPLSPALEFTPVDQSEPQIQSTWIATSKN